MFRLFLIFICVHEDPMRRIYKIINNREILTDYTWTYEWTPIVWTILYYTASVWNTSKLVLILNFRAQDNFHEQMLHFFGSAGQVGSSAGR